MDNTQNIIELCAGYGGISMGIKRVIPEIRVRAYAEIEAYAVANLVTKIEKGKMDSAPIWTNLKTFPGRSFRGKIHGIIGGYPCQPFSKVGKRKGKQDSRHLFPYILSIIESVKPLWCFFENVECHLSLGYGEVYRNLRDMGYAVEAGLFSAEEYNMPHERKRLFIMAYAPGWRQWNLFKICNKKTQSRIVNFCNNGFHAPKPRNNQKDWEESRTIKLKLGRATNGTSSRMDRIRMLGNGVVPDTAELAFRTLIEKMKK